MALRLDFFGDEIETLRRFDPADQRSTGKADSFTLMPASEALLDEGNIKRFRERYREAFGATATGDPLYQAVSDGRRMAGMEHWLPLFEERLGTLFDYLGEDDVLLRDPGTDGALEERRESVEDYFQNRTRAMQSEPGSYRPLPPAALYLAREEWDSAVASVSTLMCFQIPSAPRKLGMPEAADLPAPVRAATRFAALSR